LTFAIGENIGPYRIIEQLGQGGMATVYKAYHASLDRYVALKVLHPAFKEDPNFLGRFQREARMVARLEHPNIVPIYDFEEHEGHPFLVMKYIEGQTLKARLQKGPLSEEEILKITHAVGGALTYAHKQDILHRDIKPSNVLLANDDQIYLADFGLARLASVVDSTLSAEILVGTPQYISPEQASGVKELDARSDVYCFGVMLYEMTVGRVPFNADTPYAIVFDHIYKPLPLPRLIRPELSEELETVLLKALTKDREDRFPDVASLVKAFSAALPTSGVSGVRGTTKPAAVSQVSEPPAPPPAVKPVPGEKPTPSAKPAAAAGKPAGRKRSIWVVGAWIGLAFLLLFLILALIRIGRNWATNRVNEVMPQVAGTLSAFTPPAEFQQAALDGTLEGVVAAYEEQRMDEFWMMIGLVNEMAGERAEFYLAAGDEMVDMDVYMPAAIFYLQVFRYDPSILKPEQATRMRQIIFEQTKNREIGRLFNAARDDPLYLIALSRYEVFHKADLSQTKPRLAGFLNDQTILRAYPEVSLVMAELYIKLNDADNARQILTAMVDKSNLPGWVRDEARTLLSSIP
jgi:predicted Ser/Thr protein kinase